MQLSPREVLFTQSEAPLVKKVVQILERNRILLTHKPISEFVEMNETDLKRLCHKKTNMPLFTENPLANSCCTTVLKYLGLLANADEDKVFRLVSSNLLSVKNYRKLMPFYICVT